MTNCTDVPGSIVKTFIDVPPGEEKALVSAIAMQPISIAIEASQFVFQFYKNGVITDDSCGSRGSIDHGVLAVGYGTDLDTQEPYFLVKNSWGPTCKYFPWRMATIELLFFVSIFVAFILSSLSKLLVFFHTQGATKDS